MEFCRSALGVLILLIISTGSESTVPVVKVEYGGTAVLPCTERCTGVISWTPSHKSSDILAECDGTSCRSVKEGYQMIYNKCLNGDLSLNITEADFRKRGRYTCDCDGTDKCDAELQIETLKTSKQIESGDSLHLELGVSVSVEVIYSSTGAADGSSDQICTVNKGSLQCKSEYKHRTSLSSSSVLKLREVKDSDSGIYIIRDIDYKEEIYIYTVEVKGDPKQPQIQEKEEPPKSDADAQEKMWLVFGIGSLIVAVVGVGFLLFKKKNMFWFKKSGKLENFTHSVDSCNEQNIYSPEKSPLNHQQV